MKEVTQPVPDVAIYEGELPDLLGHNTAPVKSHMHHQLQKFHTWLRFKKLEYDLWRSRGFQKYCEKIGCPILAEMEKSYQETLKRRLGAQTVLQTSDSNLRQ